MFLNEKYKNELKVGNEIVIKNIGSYFEDEMGNIIEQKSENIKINKNEAKNVALKIGLVFIIVIIGAFCLHRRHKKMSSENDKLLI